MTVAFTAAAMTLFAVPVDAQAAPRSSFRGTVIAVHDGDSVLVRPDAGGKPRRVRLVGIDAPELCQAHGRESRDALAARALRRPVRIDTRARDDYGRTLATIALADARDDADLTRWMVANGHAWSSRFRRDAGPYAAEEATARQARRGLWRDAAAIEPRRFRKEHGPCR